jgi:hypothetical protein
VLEAILVAAGVLGIAAGVVLQRITGIGFGSASAAPLILLLGPVVGVQVVHVLAALCSALLLVTCWRDIDWRRTPALTALALAGTPVGAALALTLPAAALQIVAGLVMLAAIFTVEALARTRLMASRWGLVATGVLGGVANGAVGQAGPLVGAYALASRWPLARYLASMQVCWLLANTGAVAVKGLPPITTPLAILLLAALAVGAVVSGPIARLVSREAAVRCLVVVALVGSLLILGKGVGALLWPEA